MNVLDFPKGNWGVDLIGPFYYEYHKIAVDGYKLPHLTAKMLNMQDGPAVSLVLDERFVMDVVPLEEAQKWLAFLANCMAVAAGYSSHGENSCKMDNPFKIKFMQFDGTPK